MCSGVAYYQTLQVTAGNVGVSLVADQLAQWARQQGFQGCVRLVGVSFVNVTAVQAAGPIVVGFRLAGGTPQAAIYQPGATPYVQPLDLPLEDGQILQVTTIDADPLGTTGQIGALLYLTGTAPPSPCAG
jgi:hypothetical protein